MKKYGFLSCAFVLLVLSGCASKQLSQQAQEDLAPYIISIDRDGKLEPCSDSKKHPDKYTYSACQKTYFNKIISGIEGFKKKHKEKETKILFFIHGGLNTPDESMERAMQHRELIIRDGIYYPIFVNWDSRGLSTYKDHLTSIRQGEKSKYAKYTWPIYLLTDLGNSIINAPKAWFVAGIHLKESTKEQINEKTKQIEDQCNNLFNVTYNPTEDDKKDVKGIQRWIGNPNKSGRSLRWFVTSPAKAVTTPFVYTLAKPAWDVMLRRIDTLFYTPCDLKGESKDEYCKQSEYSDRTGHNEVVYRSSLDRASLPLSQLKPESRSGALSVFLKQIENMSKIKITLIGHSMGAIVVDKIIRLKPNLPYENIVHLASADSINNVLDIVVPYLEYAQKKGQSVQFYSLMLHPDNEDREESWYGMTQSGSLLTYIDNIYTSPQTVLDRRSGRWDNIRKVIPFIPTNIAENMHFKIFGTNSDPDEQREQCRVDKECYCPIKVPQKHGDFDDMCFWDEATWE